MGNMKVKIDPLDKLFSQYIRMRAIQLCGGCERCLTPKYDIEKEDGNIFPAWKQLDCAHLLGRWKKSIRWDVDNAIGACGGCHLVIDRDHSEKEAFIVSHLGQERYDLLKARARIPARYLDRAALTIYLKIKIREMEVRNADRNRDILNPK